VRIGVGHPGSKDLVTGYVLHDFSKADQEWLEPMLDAIAEAAGRLAAGDEARFLTDVARRMQPAQAAQSSSSGKRTEARAGPTDDGGDGKGKATATVAAAPAAPKPEPIRAPAADGQRAGSLAESLKRWLRGRGS
jgi:PTH1 family peptidyl-tRNA hydrolase